MAYEITATKKRPVRFEDLAGQEFVSTTLKAAIGAGRIAHAFLFSGPRGCGKTSTARILAKALNCEKGPTAEPCGACDSCVSITRGSGFDVIEIDGASNTSVENVRQIRDEVLFPPNSSRYKIYIIDEVHMLSNSAFNALLKTIEEPPPYVVFMFATTEVHKVPATIKSRCQQFNFRLIPVDALKALLAKVAAEDGVEIDADALLWMAKEANGSARDAYTLFDQVVSFSGGHVSAKLIREKLGLVGMERLNELFAHCAGGDARATLDSVADILSGGVSVDQCVVDAVEYCRSLLLLKAGIGKEALLGAPSSAYSAMVLETYTLPHIEQALSILLELHRNLRFSVNARFELELAFSRLCSLGGMVPRSELSAAVRAIQSLLRGDASALDALATGRKAEPAAEPAAGTDAREAPAETPIASEARVKENGASEATSIFADDADLAPIGRNDPKALRDFVIASLAKTLPALASGLTKTAEWKIGERSIVIGFENGMDLDYVRRDISTLAAKIAEGTGRAMAIELVRSERKPAAAAERDAQEETPRDAAGSEGRASPGGDDNDPVAAVSRVFRGTVVDEGPKEKEDRGER